MKKLQFEYEDKIKEFSEENEKTIKHLQDQIFNLKLKLEDYDKKYITKSEHELIYNKIKSDQNKELEMYEKEVEKLEQILRENNLLFITNNQTNLNINNNDLGINIVDIQKELQMGADNNEVVCIVSELGSPLNNGNNNEINKNVRMTRNTNISSSSNIASNKISKNDMGSNQNLKNSNKNENVLI